MEKYKVEKVVSYKVCGCEFDNEESAIKYLNESVERRIKYLNSEIINCGSDVNRCKQYEIKKINNKIKLLERFSIEEFYESLENAGVYIGKKQIVINGYKYYVSKKDVQVLKCLKDLMISIEKYNLKDTIERYRNYRNEMYNHINELKELKSLKCDSNQW